MSTQTSSISTVRSEYQNARRRAQLRSLLTAVTHSRNSLHSLREVDGKFIMEGEHYAGIRQVEVRDIVGSVARSEDFDGMFNPRYNNSRERWERVATAYLNDIILPPVELLKIGPYYFVIDGNHRVSVARHYGVQYIDAEVTEFITPCSLAIESGYNSLVQMRELISQFMNRIENVVVNALPGRRLTACSESACAGGIEAR